MCGRAYFEYIREKERERREREREEREREREREQRERGEAERGHRRTHVWRAELQENHQLRPEALLSRCFRCS